MAECFPAGPQQPCLLIHPIHGAPTAMHDLLLVTFHLAVAALVVTAAVLLHFYLPYILPNVR